MPDNSPGSWAGSLLAHNAWATLELLSFCERLAPEQLLATTAGAFGTIFETLHHFIESDGHYIRRLAPELWPPDLPSDADDAWGASLGGAAAFEWVRHGGPEASRVERRHQAFLSGNVAEAFALLRTRAETTARLWQTYVARDPEPLPMVVMPRWSREAAPAVLVAQALSHSHGHREQAGAILTSIGLEPPDLSGIAWGLAHDLVRGLQGS